MNSHELLNRTVLITGGHLTPALAVIDELQKRYPSWRVVYVGRTYALEGKHVLSEEHRLMEERNIPFISITTGRLKRDGGISGLTSLFKVPFGLAQAMWFVGNVKPSVVMSFGGYVALPVAVAARLYGIPVVTHEQTTRPGLANRLIARIATRVLLTFSDSSRYFPSGVRTVVSGLPVRREVLIPPRNRPFTLPNKPIIFVVGGSTGSVSINTIVIAALRRLVKDYVVLHQVGRLSEGTINGVRNSLPESLRTSYIARPYLSAKEYSWAIHSAHVVVGRSGANTVMELGLAGAVSILIPLPWAGSNEQYHNAKFLTIGGGEILTQDGLTSEKLVNMIHRVSANWQEKKAKAEQLAMTLPTDGAGRVVDILSQTAG